jgi:serine/threonine protein kinase
MVFGKHPLSKYNDIDSISDFLTTQDIIIPENDSILCTDLLKKMLNKNENERISLENLFIHPWIMSCSIITDEKLFDQDIYLDIEENLEIVDKKRKNSFIFDM